MIEKDLTIKLQYGLHARPASLIVSKLGAMKLDQASMTCNGETADLTSILSLLTLAAETGAAARVKISGRDAETAMSYIERVLGAEHFEAVFDELNKK
jgi:phosphotransferase system HPr (HPr) family protein